jgi:thiol-disulfide isomerase/thioredoxin
MRFFEELEKFSPECLISFGVPEKTPVVVGLTRFEFIEALFMFCTIYFPYEILTVFQSGKFKRLFPILLVIFSLTHISQAEAEDLAVNAPEFPSSLEWLNAPSPITLKSLRGKFVLLDFWTYACINCMHIVPDLNRLEREFPELVVIGVHSAKFKNEKDSKQIAKAIERFGIRHPVVNDSEFQVWEEYAVKAWPTTVLISPEGKIISTRSGEGVYEAFRPLLAAVISKSSDAGVTVKLSDRKITELRFPGKVIVDSSRIFISDSGRNRIVIAKHDGEIISVIGGIKSGFLNGGFSYCLFDEPLGLAFKDEKLYVADRKNHAIRVCDLNSEQCDTFVGSGKQGKAFNTPGTGKEVDLNSPWDLTIDGDSLFVAMAGFHQIWRVNLKTAFAEPFSGTGAEAITDGSTKNLETGGTHAQPSGITGSEKSFFTADSESSSIREIKDSQIKTLIGSGLFKFGDQDGDLDKAKLQHPLGVLVNGDSLFVADTFNSKIKLIDLKTKKIQTIAGGASAGLKDGKDSLFDEPSGLAMFKDELFVADTNNHAVRVISLKDGYSVRTLKLSRNKNWIPEYSAAPMSNDAKVNIKFQLPEGHSFNEMARSEVVDEDKNVTLVKAPGEISLKTGVYSGTIYYCEDKTKLCLLKKIKFKVKAQPVSAYSFDTVLINDESDLD